MKNTKMGEMNQTRPKRYLEAHTTEKAKYETSAEWRIILIKIERRDLRLLQFLPTSWTKTKISWSHKIMVPGEREPRKERWNDHSQIHPNHETPITSTHSARRSPLHQILPSVDNAPHSSSHSRRFCALALWVIGDRMSEKRRQIKIKTSWPKFPPRIEFTE